MKLRRFAPAVGLLLLPATASAHGPASGADHFDAGFLHPLLVPAHLLALLACGVLAGLQEPRRLRAATFAYPAAVAAGLAASVSCAPPHVEPALLAAAAITGILAALDARLPPAAGVALALALGSMIGVDSARNDLSGTDRLAALLGTGIAACLLPLYALGFTRWFGRAGWRRILLRVLGSWAAASALLVLSLAFAA